MAWGQGYIALVRTCTYWYCLHATVVLFVCLIWCKIQEYAVNTQ